MLLFYFALCLQVSLLLYFGLITLFNLYPWNDLSKYTTQDKLKEAIVNGLFLIACLVLFLTGVFSLMVISVFGFGIFFIMQMLVWWLPYLTGIHLKQFPRSLYESHFQETVKILPPRKDNIVPDAQHNLLQLLSLTTVVVSALTLFQS